MPRLSDPAPAVRIYIRAAVTVPVAVDWMRTQPVYSAGNALVSPAYPPTAPISTQGIAYLVAIAISANSIASDPLLTLLVVLRL